MRMFLLQLSLQIHVHTNRECLWKETQETEGDKRSEDISQRGRLLILYLPLDNLHFYLMHVTFSNNILSCVSEKYT